MKEVGNNFFRDIVKRVIGYANPMYAELELYKSMRQDIVDGLSFELCEQCRIPYCIQRSSQLVICHYNHDGFTRCGGVLCCNRLMCTMERIPRCIRCQTILCSEENMECSANYCECPGEPHKIRCTAAMCLETCTLYCEMCQESFCPEHIGDDELCACCSGTK